ncbi:pyridoxamine 5'-phosphate oxidase family protein [Nocardia sp. alder85J]|uniref:pyridoxamine 5'-phosphate oxidase family protein n=1 Tax=Nocardia sp. alder85J TaxID=2862949 RepID=UPI001CD5B0DC|nr:pyridoxamine 5'-phosphate oxidase family protein [Nocardia sp. alder85J]MCX4095957.1 pyridoxamine 5'-phosphate oxidase family protein [Nocardia sp. alder85J]
MAVHGERELRELTDGDSLRLLATVRFGRLVVNRHSVPIIRPVNHLVEGDDLIIYAGLGIGPPVPERQVVAYEADTIDHETQLGWCVILTGPAETVADHDAVARYERLMDPWLPGARPRILRMRPDAVTGIELVGAAGVPGSSHGSRP